MANITVTNNDLGSVILKDAQFRDELLVFAAAVTVLEGTILARRSVATAITVAADAGNTGDGTCTLATVVAGPVPLVGAHSLICVTATTNGGTFKLIDPNGMTIANALVMTAGAGTATLFDVAGMTFTLTDAAADFVVGDNFDLTVAIDGKMVPYETDGVGGEQIPLEVVTYDVVAAGSGNIGIRGMIAGSVRAERLIIDSDADGTNVTAAILDQLRDIGIVAISVTEQNSLDNQ